MKKYIQKIIITILLCCIPTITKAAGTASISGPASVTNGANATIKVTISNTAAWNISITGSGSTPGCSTKVADVTADGNNTTKTFQLTCKANSIGVITFKANGDITSSDGSKSYVNLSKNIEVVKPREKDPESRLNSISIEGYNINFSKDQKEYFLEIEPTVNNITIKANAISKYATVSGTGTKEVNSDLNEYLITCTSETGAKTTYKIKISVKDSNPISIKIKDKTYHIIKNKKSLKTPTNFEETTIKINNTEIPAYKNETTKLNVIGIKDINGNISYAIYEDNSYKLYNENKSDSLLLYITEKELKGFKKEKIIIQEKEYIGYKINDRFYIVHATNILNGESNFYKYDSKENTFQVYETLNNATKKEKKVNIFIITTILFGATTISPIIYKFIIKKRKKQTKNKKSQK